MSADRQQKTVLYLRVDLGGQQLVAGGSVAHTVGVIKGFAHHGWRVVCASSAMITVLRTLAISVQELKNPALFKPLRWKLNCLLSNIFFTYQALRFARAYNVTYVYQRHGPFSCVGVLCARWLKVPLLLEYNGSEVWMNKHWNERSWFSLTWLLAWCERISLKHALRVVVVSQPLVDELVVRGVPAQKIVMHPNGVHTDEFDPATLTDVRARLRRQYRLHESFVFGFVGTFSPWHGITILAHMIPAVLSRDPRARFMLIGDGPLRQWLYEQVQGRCGQYNERIIWTGTVAQQEAKNYLAACDAFLLPTQPNADGSRFFGSPVKLFEYMSMGKPIIASSVEQVAEILQQAVTVTQLKDGAFSNRDACAILIPPHDVQGFVDAACTLAVRDAMIGHHLGVNARQRVLKRHTWEAHVETIITAL